MDQTLYNTANTALKRASNILIALPQKPTGDAIGSALALLEILERKNKSATIVGHDFQIPKHLKFVPGINKIETAVAKLQRFVISLNTAKSKVDELTYAVVGDTLKIYLTPKLGSFTAKDVETTTSEFRYDLIITIDAPDYLSLGEMFQNHADFFYNTPTIAIDKSTEHELYGNINLVDMAASSNAEIVYNLAKDNKDFFLTPDIATKILLGIILETRSFKTPTVTPRTLEIASELMSAGGRRGEIIEHVYRTKSLNTLQLWGRALARLKHDPEIKLAWTVLTKQDFVLSGATDENLHDVLDELIQNSPDASIAMILYEHENIDNQNTPGICAILAAQSQHNIHHITASLNPTGSQTQIHINLTNTNILESEKKILEVIKKNFKR